MSDNNKNKLDALTGLRFFAAMAIVAFHVQGSFGLPAFPTSFAPIQGVSFFFVLSGFILTYRYPKLRGSLQTRQFLRSRFARIWPAHIAAMAIAMVLMYGTIGTYPHFYSLDTFVASLLLVQSWFGLNQFFLPYNPVSWSISTEMAFYFLFPFLIRSFEKSWHVKLIGAVLLAAATIWLANFLQLPNLNALKPGPSVDALVYIHPAARLFEFVLGMCSALLWRNTRLRLHGSVWTILELLACLLVLFNVPLLSQLIDLPALPPATKVWLQTSGSVALPAAILIFVAASQRGLISELLASQPMVLLGEISFSLYLVHYTFFRLYQTNAYMFSGTSNLLLLIGYSLTCLVVSHLLWKFVETPARLLLSGHRPVRAPKTNWLLTAGEISVLIAVGAGIVLTVYENSPFISIAKADLVREHSEKQFRDVAFGPNVKVIGMYLSADPPTLNVAWLAVKDTGPNQLFFLHFVRGDDLVWQTTSTDPRSAVLHAGEFYLDKFPIAKGVIGPGVSAGIVLFDNATNQPAAVSSESTDWNGGRLRFAIPRL